MTESFRRRGRGRTLCLAAVLVTALFPRLVVAAEPACAAPIHTLHPGMSRAEVEAVVSEDGGIHFLYRMERYLLRTCVDGNGKRPKVNLQFRPVDVPETVFRNLERSSEWQSKHRRSPTDQLVDVSEVYWEDPFSD